MQPQVDITLPSDQTDTLLADLREIEGLLGLRVQRGISEQPRGDVISVDTLPEAHLDLLALLEARGIGADDASSVTISRSSAMISPTVRERLGDQENPSSWEQIEAAITKSSTMSASGLAAMFVSGAFAAIGITTGAIHLAVGALMIAPAFQPVIRISLGLFTRNDAWRRGLRDAALGYAAVIVGAIVGALLIQATSPPLLKGSTAYEAVAPLVRFWTSLGIPGAFVGLLGGFIGAVVVASGRLLLTAGVTVALALVPTATMIGVALVAGDVGVMGEALARFLAEVLFTLVGSSFAWAWIRGRIQPRSSMV